MLATLRLFKALPVDGGAGSTQSFALLAARTVPNGYIVAPEVATQYTHFSILNQIDELYGRNGRELNNAFHKSFATVRDSSMEQLVFQQMLHYLTTYGAQHYGIYHEDSIYIPAEALDVPQFDGARLIVIRGLHKLELREELLKLLRSGIALSEQTVKDCVEIAEFIGPKAFNAADVESVKNREVKVALYDLFGMVPDSPVEFLRFIVYRATGETLLIKNAPLINKLRERDLTINKYFPLYSPAKLATIFYRYKPVFLALRTDHYMKGYINEVRRLAVKHHKPMPEDYLNSVTARIENGEGFKVDELSSALQSANTFRKIRLAYALKFRGVKPDSILYRVRNGKSFAKAFKVRNPHGASTIGDFVLHFIVNDLRANVAGKSIYIPAGVRYALPATEKQFTGHLPTGTCVEVDEDLVVGIHWNNLDGPKGGHATKQIDLDLSIANVDGKIGWDGHYRNPGSSILFSGDLTSAPPPHGASEVFYIGGQGSWLMSVNYYNAGYSEIDPVPFKILAAREDRANIGRNRVIDPNKIIAFSNSVMDVKQKTVGLIVADGQSKRFYFTEAEFMSGRTARHTTAAEHARKYLVSYYENTISLNDVLALAGADLVAAPEAADIDLSPEAVDKSTIINLISGENR